MTHICVRKLAIIGHENGFNIISWTLGNILQWNLNRNLYIFIQENAVENVRILADILSRPQYANKTFWYCQLRTHFQSALRCNKIAPMCLPSGRLVPAPWRSRGLRCIFWKYVSSPGGQPANYSRSKHNSRHVADDIFQTCFLEIIIFQFQFQTGLYSSHSDSDMIYST